MTEQASTRPAWVYAPTPIVLDSPDFLEKRRQQARLYQSAMDGNLTPAVVGELTGIKNPQSQEFLVAHYLRVVKACGPLVQAFLQTVAWD